jgi:catechol 2,3-dioxygenase-like lactoylglutathione lyase family enzyme
VHCQVAMPGSRYVGNDRVNTKSPDKEVVMLGNKDATATIAVKNLETAKRFYEGTVGLRPAGVDEPGVVAYKSGSSTVLVYESQYAGTNQATAVTWVVGNDLDGVVQALKGKGVSFEHYDLPETTRHGDVHVSGNTRVAWFKDPDGNILSIVNS